MNEVFKRVVDAVTDAIDKPKYVVRYSPDQKTWEIWCNDKRIWICINHDLAEEICEKMNYEYIARRAIEALKPITGEVCHPKWERALDAILE